METNPNLPAGERLGLELIAAKEAAMREGQAGLPRRRLFETCQRFIDNEVERVLSIRTKVSRVMAKPSAQPHAVIREIYDAYPRKVAPAKAFIAIKNAITGGVPQTKLLDATRGYAAAVKRWPRSYRFKDGRDTVPYPASWFTAGRYADDPEEWRPPSQGRSEGFQYAGLSRPERPLISEPAGWRDEFPNFLHIQKPWEELSEDHQRTIATTMELARKLSVPAGDEPSRPSLLFPPP